MIHANRAARGVLRSLLGICCLACVDRSATPDSSPEPSSAANQVVDAAGIAHVISTPPARIISLVPSATETLVAIGALNLIVARTDFDDAPEVSSLPSIGAGLQPNLEAILARAPDMVIYFHGSSDEATPRRLSEAGIQAFGVRPDRVEDVRKIIRDLGALTGRAQSATELLAELDLAMQDIAVRIEGRERVRTVFLLGGDPPWVAGPDSYLSELITAAGGENVFSDIVGLYSPTSMEEFLVREIDLVLTGPNTEVQEQIARLGVKRIPAFIELPGPRLHLAARALAEALHPEAFR